MLQIGLIGTGYWGPNLANSVERTGKARLRWMCDTNPKNLATVSRRFGHAKTTTALADVLSDRECDAVFVSTPSTTHYTVAKQALMAGKHVLVEKPLTTRSDHARELIQIAAERQRILMVGHVFEYNAAVRLVAQLVKSGELGAIYYLNFERTNLGPVRTDVNALWDLASHDASIMCDFMGATPHSVTAKGQAYLNPGIEDVVFATFMFEDCVTAHVHASWLNPNKVRQITVVGSRKMVVCDDLDLRQPVRLYDKTVGAPALSEITGSFLQHKTIVIDSGLTVPVVQAAEPLLTELEHFIDCIETNRTPRSDGRSGLHVVELMEAATESIKHNSVVVPIGSAAHDEPAPKRLSTSL